MRRINERRCRLPGESYVTVAEARALLVGAVQLDPTRSRAALATILGLPIMAPVTIPWDLSDQSVTIRETHEPEP